MAYFPNSCYFDIWHSKNCGNDCANYRLDKKSDTWGCPITDAHYLFQDDYANNYENPLEILIPHRKDGHVGKCKMYLAKFVRPRKSKNEDLFKLEE